MQQRDYQDKGIANCIECIDLYDSFIRQLPTGGGKTVEFSLISQKYCRSHNKSVLILVHRQELLYQAAKTIKSIMGIDPYLITQDTKHLQFSRVYIGMVDSTMRRLHTFHNVGLIIIDECHVAVFNKVHAVFPNEKIMGVTATPVSSSKREPLNKYYKKIVVGPQINELIAAGYLAQNITRCPKEVVDSTKFEIDNRKGDYNENAMAHEYRKPKNVINVVRNYNKFFKGTKTIVFNVNIEHSKEVNECFQFCGYNSRHLDASVGDVERKEILEWFAETDDAILNNVMITTVGFDEPTIRNVINNYSTLSLVKFIQTSGRGGRKIPGKDYFNILDMGGNCIRFGDWNDDRDWEFIFHNPGKVNEGIAPVKTCPKCEGLVHASLMTCPLTDEKGELCLYVFKKKVAVVEKDLHEMILITKGIDVDTLIGKHKSKYTYFTFFEMGHDIVKNLYASYPDPSETKINEAFKAYYELCIDWFKKTLAGKEGALMDIRFSDYHIRMAKNNFNRLITKYKFRHNDFKKEIIKPKIQEPSKQALATSKFIPMGDWASIYGR